MIPRPDECVEVRDLAGGYVLGALDAEERERVERHLVQCPACRAEIEDLRSLPGLIDLAADEAPAPPARLEEAVLDRLALERGRRRRHPSFAAWTGGAVAAAAAVAAALVLVLGGGGGDPERAEPWTAGRYVVKLEGAGPAQGRAALKETPGGMSVKLRAGGLPAGAVLEMTCVKDDGTTVPGGSFTVDARGHAYVDLTAAVRRGNYHLIRIARPGADRAVLTARLPRPAGRTEIRDPTYNPS